MKRSTLVYIAYLISIITLTVLFSIKIISNKKEFQIIGYSPKVLTSNFSNCPCKEIGTGPPACPHDFMERSNNSFLSAELRPNYEGIYDGLYLCQSPVYIKINSYGFRDKEYPLIKPPNACRIIAIGDSHTFGLGVNLEDSYPKVLERLLNERNDGKNYEVLNFGVPGYDIIEKIEVLRSKALNFSPNIIIFQYTGDDIISNIELGKEIRKAESELKQKLGRPLTLEERVHFEARIRLKALKEVDERKAQEIIKNSFEKLASYIPFNTEIIILTIHTPEFQKAPFPEIVKKNHWYIIDLDTLFFQHSGENLYLNSIDLHLNPFGYQLVTEKIYNLLVEKNILFNAC
ncbi:MAG: SGNH/GDSL hydrolase family protein [Candidatus Aenigmatarchaeota archaeon]